MSVRCHEQVDEEWSFIETLRHLLFATDAWVRRVILGDPSPWHPLDLPWDEMPDTEGTPRDRAARPGLDEVLALRADRMAGVRAVITDLTDAQLAGTTEPVDAPGWPPAHAFEWGEPLRVVLNEEWWHRRYAERDLAVLAERAGSPGRRRATMSEQDAQVRVDPPWEPPVAGTEVEHLFGALDRLRVTFRWKADGLDSAGLATRVGASSLTLGALLKHLALVEDDISTRRLDGSPHPDVWRGYDPAVPDWEFVSAAEDSPAQLYALWDGAVARARARFAAAVAERGLDAPSALAWPDGDVMSIRRLVCDQIEEYGRHTGHADLLREAVDGRVGEDPPHGWRPVAGPGLWW